jgi:hypothetical protein
VVKVTTICTRVGGQHARQAGKPAAIFMIGMHSELPLRQLWHNTSMTSGKSNGTHAWR